MKYLGIIYDSKLAFREHVNHMAEKCTKLIFTLSKSAKLNWGAKTRSPEDNIHRRKTTSPIMRRTVWRKAIDKASYKSKLVRVQRLINIKIAKTYRSVHRRSLYTERIDPIAIKIQETSRFYQLTKGNRREEVLVDRDTITFLTESNEAAGLIQIFTDGSKSEQKDINIFK